MKPLTLSGRVANAVKLAREWANEKPADEEGAILMRDLGAVSSASETNAMRWCGREILKILSCPVCFGTGQVCIDADTGSYAECGECGGIAL